PRDPPPGRQPPPRRQRPPAENTAPAPQEPRHGRRRAALTAALTRATATITSTARREHALTRQTEAKNSRKGAHGALEPARPGQDHRPARNSRPKRENDPHRNVKTSVVVRDRIELSTFRFSEGLSPARKPLPNTAPQPALPADGPVRSLQQQLSSRAD